MSRSTKAVAGPITYWHMEWDAQTHIHGENRSVTINLRLPYPTLLRLLVTPSSGLQNQNLIADFLKEQAAIAPEETKRYIADFFTALSTVCKPGATDLAVIDTKKNGDFDFPRPSPSWMMIREFCLILKRDPQFHPMLQKHCQEFLR